MQLIININSEMLCAIYLILYLFLQININIFSQVVNETLRIANIIGGVFRRAITDITIKGTLLEKTLLSLNSRFVLFMILCSI